MYYNIVMGSIIHYWEYLPNMALVNIFSNLSRRDRLACTLVCNTWREAMQTSLLWTHFQVYIDTDLSEPSTMLMMRYYHNYITSLELDWKRPDLPQRWIPLKLQELTKRICRFIMVMLDTNVQLNSIAFHRFYERFRMKKVSYYLSMFIRSQKNLKSVDFNRALFNKTNFLRHFKSLECSFDHITHLNILDGYFGTGLLQAEFSSTFVNLKQLRCLKVEYITFCYELINAIINSKGLRCLERIETHFYEDDDVEPISNEKWLALSNVCPKVKVSMYFNDISHISRLKNKFQAGIPLTTCSIVCTQNLDELIDREYTSKELITFIATNYSNSLEHFKLHLKDNHTILDDFLLELANKCTKLQSFEFFGIIHKMEILQDIFKRDDDFKSYSIATENVSRQNFQLMVTIYDEIGSSDDCTVDFKMFNKNADNYVSIHG